MPEQDIQPRPEVMAFARLMEERLRANDHKSHWRESLSVDEAYGHLLNEVNELVMALIRGDASDIASECADVANYAMMVADLADGLRHSCDEAGTEVATMSERLTPERIAELRRIAEAATKGPWRVNKYGSIGVGELGIAPVIANVEPFWSKEEREKYGDHGDNARYIAAFDPPTTLALLDEIERLRQEREQTLFVLDQAVNGIRWWMDAHPGSASGADDEWLYEAEQILRPGEQQEGSNDDDA